MTAWGGNSQTGLLVETCSCLVFLLSSTTLCLSAMVATQCSESDCKPFHRCVLFVLHPLTTLAVAPSNGAVGLRANLQDDQDGKLEEILKTTLTSISESRTILFNAQQSKAKTDTESNTQRAHRESASHSFSVFSVSYLVKADMRLCRYDKHLRCNDSCACQA